MNLKSSFIIMLLLVFGWVCQIPAWAAVSQPETYTLQNPNLSDLPPINFKLDLSDTQVAMNPQLMSELNALLSTSPNVTPSIFGKNGLNDFVMISGIVILSIYYGIVAFGLLGSIFGSGYFSNFIVTLLMLLAAFLPTFPSLPYLFAGRSPDEIVSHFLATGFFSLVPIISVIISGILFKTQVSGSDLNLIVWSSLFMYLATLIWGIVDVVFFANKSQASKALLKGSLTNKRASCKQEVDPLTGNQFLNCRMVAYQHQF